jgi:hypothetical protein
MHQKSNSLLIGDYVTQGKTVYAIDDIQKIIGLLLCHAHFLHDVFRNIWKKILRTIPNENISYKT